jgi:itaconate CoA-transferase
MPGLAIVDVLCDLLLAEHIGIDTFLITVSSMDQHGYFTLGTGNDYSSKVARAARHLIVEANSAACTS